jgi:hypothetical protein
MAVWEGGQCAVQNVRLRLEAWREAERRRDGLALGSPEWQEAEEDVRIAAKLVRAEVAQASVRCAEEEFHDLSPWLSATRRRSARPQEVD